MGNILAGSLMILSVLLMNLIVAFIVSNSGDLFAADVPGCDFNENNTECETVSTGNFLSAFLSVSLTGLNDLGAPFIINALYVLLMGSMLVVGAILIVSGFIPLVPG